MKEFFRFNLFSLILLALIVVTASSVYCQFQTFALVHTADPLKNIKVKVAEPVYTNSAEIVWVGTYDREVACRLVKFHLLLTNGETKDVILLNANHLTRTPIPNSEPGTNFPINFAMKTPDHIYPGVWSSVFFGEYVCRKGIFQSIRRVQDPVDKFLVKKPV